MSQDVSFKADLFEIDDRGRNRCSIWIKFKFNITHPFLPLILVSRETGVFKRLQNTLILYFRLRQYSLLQFGLRKWFSSVEAFFSFFYLTFTLFCFSTGKLVNFLIKLISSFLNAFWNKKTRTVWAFSTRRQFCQNCNPKVSMWLYRPIART